MEKRLDDQKLTHISLFSGIGGFDLAGEWAEFKTVVFCEKDEFCQKVLKKHWPEIPAIPEIRDFDGTKWRGATILTGGFPCQPFSVAGKRRGKEDDRYLWPEMFRVISEARPAWVLAENVAGIVKLALDTCLSDLESEDYETETFIIPACAVNAPHRRDRVWIIARDASREGLQGDERELESAETIAPRPVAGNTESVRLQHRGRESKTTSKWEGSSQDANSDAPNAPHRRDGVWIIAHSQCLGWKAGAREKIRPKEQISERQNIRNLNPEGNAPDHHQQGLQRYRKSEECKGKRLIRTETWEVPWIEVATSLCRVDDGISNRVDRLKVLGNAIVPQIAYEIMKKIAWIERGNNEI